MVEFGQMVRVLQSLGTVKEKEILTKKGKPSKFMGEIEARVNNKNIKLGLLHYNWKRSIGVNKIQQASQYIENADVDGAIIVGTKFTRSAIDQAYRNNEVTDKRILLLDLDEIGAAYENLID